MNAIHLNKFKPGFVLTLCAGLLLMAPGCATSNKAFIEESRQRARQSAQFTDGEFQNKTPTNLFSFSKMGKMFREAFGGNDSIQVPESELPIRQINDPNARADDLSSIKFAKLGHSSLILWINEQVWLTDPVFSQRASVFQWIGPERFHPLPLNPTDLTEIEGVIISHDHYDHLDYGTIMALKDKVKHFYTPLGVGVILAEWGVSPDKITELDWWESKKVGDIEIAATPAQHFSGRALIDGGKTLWASWVIRWDERAVFFSGDTGYFDGFKEIGDRYGPFDVAFMENGAYNKLWSDIHMLPEETVQAFKDVRGKLLVPIHNSTFNLAPHDWFDPMESMMALARENEVNLLIPYIGQVVDALNPPTTIAWWRELLPQEKAVQLVSN